jgi:hypothetical protein
LPIHYIATKYSFLLQKASLRKAAIEKSTSLDDNTKKMLLPLMVPDLMSSDESIIESSQDEQSDSESESPRRKVVKLIRHPIPYRTLEFNTKITSLDRKIDRKRDDKAKKMVIPVETGEPSSRRLKPGYPEWAVDYNKDL